MALFELIIYPVVEVVNVEGTFYSVQGIRPVRLPERTRDLAVRALAGEFGRMMHSTPSINLDSLEFPENGTDVRKYAFAVMAIAENAPLRIVPGEKLVGAATLDSSRSHVVPACYRGKPVFQSTSHVTPGFAKVLKTGCGALRRQICDRLTGGDLDAAGRDFLEGLLQCLDALVIWHRRYLDLLQDLIRQSGPEEQKAYTDLYENLKDVPENPPATFRQAIQSLWFLFAFHRLCGNWPGIGRFDEMLGGYLKSDLDKGIITIDQARDLVAHFWIKGCEWITGESSVSGDAQHYQNIVLSGVDKNGLDVTNEVTGLVLDIVEELGISDFPVAVRISQNTPASLLRRVAEAEAHGGGIVAVYNENLIIQSLVDFGYELREARQFANDGCWEIQIPGKTRFIYMPFNMLALLQNGVLKINDPNQAVDYPTFASLYQAYLTELGAVVADLHLAADRIDSQSHPSPIISLFTEGCIENARDYYNRGPKYISISPHAGLLPDTANSLLAIKKFVYEEQLIKLQELVVLLRKNWEGAEDLRRHIANSIEYFGNDNPEADAMARRLLQDYLDFVAQVKCRNGVLRPAGVSTFGRQIEWRWQNGATADGHFNGEILANNLSPSPGSDKYGATAVIKSHCSLDLRRLTCGTALDIKLMPAAVKGESGIAALQSLLRSFVILGGFFMQVDVIDNAVLLEAKKHPEKYWNLSVRVAGWSARFVTLSEEWQDMIIARTSH
ncbi:MAG TPA: hypothetical protein DD640_09060 [Clostridiales bacterium]|nr:hypothetical protein [Clostridiales bacterium]